MRSIRLLTSAPMLRLLLAATTSVAWLGAWHDFATAPDPTPAPTLGLGGDPPVARAGVRMTAVDDAPPPPAPYTLRLVQPEAWEIAVFATESRFPAIAGDGTIVELFHDEEDFTGAPITTLVAWSPAGARIASFQVGGAGSDVRSSRAELRGANAWLAGRSLRALDGEAKRSHAEDSELTTLTAASGPALVFDAAKGQLTRGRRQIRARFPSPGSGEYGPCGGIRGIGRAFGSDRVIVLVPDVTLGGDSCMGSPSADLAVAVALR